MTTEILGFIIIIGAVLVFVARRYIQKAEDDPEVLEASTGRLRYELEQSADEIISRMTEHIDRLERLLREADYKAELLQNKLDEMQVAQYGATTVQPPQYNQTVQTAAINEQQQAVSDMQSGAGQYEAEAQPAYEPGFDQLLQEQLQAQTNVEDINWQDNVGAAQSTPAFEQVQSTREWIAPEAPLAELLPEESLPEQPVEQANTAQLTDTQLKALQFLREASMQLEAEYEAQTEQAIKTAAPIQTGAETLAAAAEQVEQEIPASVQFNNDQIEAATARARELLALDYEVEDIARTTGLGIGAVQLMRQMQQR